MSIEDQRQKAEQAFAQLFVGMSEEDYARNFEGIAYAKEFLNRFPALAPGAWSNLLQQRTEIDPLMASFLSGKSEKDAANVFATADTLAKDWCKEHRMVSKSGWIEKVVALTLYGMSLREPLGQEAPSSFTFLQLLFLDPKDEHRIIVEEMDPVPLAHAWLDASPGPQLWDFTKETQAQFRDRVIQEFTERLNLQIKALGPTPVTPKTLEVNFQWIDWAILRLAEGHSEYAVAKQRGVSRPAVNNGVSQICDILGLVNPFRGPAT